MTERSKEVVKLYNFQTGETTVDRFYNNAPLQDTRCTKSRCLASISSFGGSTKSTGKLRTVDEIKTMAKDFFDQYFTFIKKLNSPQHIARWEQVLGELEEKGTYELTTEEVTLGAKLAWRNSVRCISRIQWSRMMVFDARNIITAAGMYDAIIKHIKYATNNGNIRTTMTIFPHRKDGEHDYRVWNQQVIAYAGYKNPEDGSIIGDPSNVEFTAFCQSLGWKGKGTRFDILPLVLNANGDDPEYFDIPADLVLEVNFTHPQYDIESLGLKWFCVPIVSGMGLDVGGLEFTGCPFNGWYMSTEIGCRDLGDVQRYNVYESVAKVMGLNTKNPTTLWKDRAMLEMNVSVLHSFQKAGVTIVDHHTAAESFMKHYNNEQRARGGCPADWIWIVPPMSGSATPVFHLETAVYQIKPGFTYMESAWKTHVWKKESPIKKESKKKWTFKQVARAVIFSSKLYSKALSQRIKATILYATETGNSEQFAKRLRDIFGHGFNAEICRMDEYDFTKFGQESLVLVVTSTFGNGEPPENGHSFATKLHGMTTEDGDDSQGSSKSFIKKNSKETTSSSPADETNVLLSGPTGPLTNLRFAVFGLGSTAYPTFAAFGKYIDNLLGQLGGERLMEMTGGDELAGQDIAFRAWSSQVFKSACEEFSLDVEQIQVSVPLTSETITILDVRLAPRDGVTEAEALSKLHGRKVVIYSYGGKTELQEPGAERTTATVVLKNGGEGKEVLPYVAGDHVGILAVNRSELVSAILERMDNTPVVDDPVQLEIMEKKQTITGVEKTWNPHSRLPSVSLRELLTRYLDISTPLRPDVFIYLARCSLNTEDKESLLKLAHDTDEYEHWKNYNWPDLVTVLNMFPSVKPDAAILCYLLPILQPRYYSISSSSLAYPNEIHLTVAVVNFKTQGGEGPIFHGVCSNYIVNQLEVGANVPCFIRTATNFHMPEDLSQPIVMVGPGSGIAPFRGFWQQRKVALQNGSEAGKMDLFFGCQRKDSILYKSEIEGLQKDGIVSDYFVALSRDPDSKKTYVQDKIKEDAENLGRTLLKENGHVYICGDCTMAEGVYQTLKSVIADQGNMDDEKAEDFMHSLRDGNRYHEDIYGITHRAAEVSEQVHKTARANIDAKN